MTTKIGLLALAAVALLAACGPSPETAAPVAPVPEWQVDADAGLIASDMRWGLMRVEGRSMEPQIWAGQWVLYDAHTWESTGPGADVLFRRGGEIYVHRVIQRTGGALETRGINGPRRDAGIVTRDAYVGTVRAIFYGGQNLCKTPSKKPAAASATTS